MNKDFFIKQIDDIIKGFHAIKSKATYDDLSGNVEIEEISAVMTRAKAAISRIAGCNSEYYKDVEATLKKRLTEGERLRDVIGTITGLKTDLQNDYLKSLNDIIKSEVFSDYLEMAEHLLTEGYKDPSAVIIGSTLEIHLRELCLLNGIDIDSKNSKGNLVPKKADLMNSDLAKANIYSSTYQKQIVAWLSIRNSAAHGKYSDYSNEEVKLMLQGVRLFILTTK